MSIPLLNSELWRIMPSNQRKGDVKLTSIQISLVTFLAGGLNIFTEAREQKLEIKAIAQMAADITEIVRKISYDLSLKSRELIKPFLKQDFRFFVQQIMNLQCYYSGKI